MGSGTVEQYVELEVGGLGPEQYSCTHAGGTGSGGTVVSGTGGTAVRVRVSRGDAEGVWAGLLARLWGPLASLAADSRTQFAGARPGWDLGGTGGTNGSTGSGMDGSTKSGTNGAHQWAYHMFVGEEAAAAAAAAGSEVGSSGGSSSAGPGSSEAGVGSSTSEAGSSKAGASGPKRQIKTAPRSFAPKPRAPTGLVLVGAATRTPAIARLFTSVSSFQGLGFGFQGWWFAWGSGCWARLLTSVRAFQMSGAWA